MAARNASFAQCNGAVGWPGGELRRPIPPGGLARAHAGRLAVVIGIAGALALLLALGMRGCRTARARTTTGTPNGAPAVLAGGRTPAPAAVQNAIDDFRMAELYRLGRQHEAAVTCYREALKALPRRAPAYQGLGLSLRATGNATEAEKALRQALKLESTLVQARMALGDLLLESGRIAEARDQYETLWRQNRGDFAIGLALWRLRLQQDPTAAAAIHAELLQLSPQDRRLASIAETAALPAGKR